MISDVGQLVDHLFRHQYGHLVSTLTRIFGFDNLDNHLEAGIAACHSLAPMYELTDWHQILGYYDQLVQLNPSPVVILNRAVALSMIEGPHSGIRQLHAIQRQVPMKEYFLFHATLADFCRRAGLTREARDAYQRAVQFAGSDAERRFLLGKLETLE